jgi:4-hydroxy-3-methylbut-2-enyl diphosphate reductase
VSDPLLVCAALRVEARAARAVLAVDPSSAVVRVGMRAAAARLIGAGPVALIGFGGGLDPAIEVGDVVVATGIVTTAGADVECAGTEALAASLRSAGLRVHVTPIAASTRIVHGAARGQLAAATGAGAVDMESAVLGTLVGGRPFAVVRVIVDTPSRRLTRLSMLPDGLHAYRTLREVARALPGWAAQLHQLAAANSTNSTNSTDRGTTHQRVS